MAVLGAARVEATVGSSEEVSAEVAADSVVSFHAELPLPLQQAMTSFIERYPNWDQYRLVQAALAGFLVQNGVESREITRLYVGNMFRRQSFLQGV
ncbi:MAG: DUF2811 domain-containing protein [Synechococcus sp.]